MTATSSRSAASEGMRRPYAPPSHLIAVLKRARSRNLPDRITTDFMGLAGIPSPMAPRTTFALKFLGLTEEDGSPTDALRAIAGAGESEYREILTKAIRMAYADDFERIDPSVDSQQAIADAFARYQPRSQTSRMVMTLLGLCREAEIPVLEAPRKRELLPPGKRGGRQAAPAAQNQPQTPGRDQPQTPGRARPTPTAVSQEADPILFAVSDSDIAVLEEEEFIEVWAALGKVARARARARYVSKAESPGRDGEAGDDEVQ